MSTLTDRFDRAYAYASSLHRDDRRKGGDVPYLTHLMSVAALVLEDGGDEDEAIAALLHDAVEDHGSEQLSAIRAAFGPRVESIVLACSDSVLPAGSEKADWRTRKREYLVHLERSTDIGYLRVTLADKVHNARSILLDLRAVGPILWDRFTTKSASDQLWYYRRLLEAFRAHRADGLDSPLIEELGRLVGELMELSGAPD